MSLRYLKNTDKFKRFFIKELHVYMVEVYIMARFSGQIPYEDIIKTNPIYVQR